ncbi:hypothetical protein FHT12_000521 [Xanthomonas campestris]|uniref:hypothetical protein n=1 Tax=Xanthomonas euroxanthea TaxID=2259622 RepID=UPI001FBA58D7|nr:hypothetical protein [Xanthomonas euroxanthea]NIJ91863.1 hypothetical protein [Xanthomonas euroxanthea]
MSETATEPGAHLLIGIKVATRAAYDANVVTPNPDADPLAQEPDQRHRRCDLRIEDRGAALGVLAAPIADLIAPTYAIRLPASEVTQNLLGWKLSELIKAAIEIAIANSLAGRAVAAG